MLHPRTVKRLRKAGNGHILLLPKAMLDLLSVTETTDLVIRSDGQRLLVRPVAPVRKTPPVGLVKNLFRLGGSWALSLEKSIIDLLGFTLEMDLEIITDGKAFVIQPHHYDPAKGAALTAAADAVVTNAVELEGRSAKRAS